MPAGLSLGLPAADLQGSGRWKLPRSAGGSTTLRPQNGLPQRSVFVPESLQNFTRSGVQTAQRRLERDPRPRSEIPGPTICVLDHV